nr:myosin-13-like [Nothobranchius furzeri]
MVVQQVEVDYDEIIDFDMDCEQQVTLKQEMETPEFKETENQSTISAEPKIPLQELLKQENDKRVAAEACYLSFIEQTEELDKWMDCQQNKFVTLDMKLQEQKNVNEDLNQICSDLKGETEEGSRFSGIPRTGLETMIMDLEKQLSNENADRTKTEKKLDDKQVSFKQQLEQKDLLCENLQDNLNQERQLRLSYEQDLKNSQHIVTVNENLKEVRDLKRQNSDLREMLDKVKRDQRLAETKRLGEQNYFKHQLKENKLVCENLEKSLSKESQRRLLCEKELKETKDQISVMSGNMKKLTIDLNKTNVELSEKLAKADEMSEELESCKQQLQQKSSVCEELRESLTKERQLRLNNEAELMENKVKLGEISQLKQENDQLQQRNIYLCVTMYQLSCGRNEEVEKFKTQLTQTCEILQNNLTEERKLRLSYEAELDKNRAIISENSHLKNEIIDLKQRNADLCVSMDVQSCRRDEELENFKTQLTEISEELQNTLSEEEKLRLSYEAELDKNRAIISENSHLKNEIIDLKQRNADLCLVIDQQNVQRAESDRKLAQELQSVEQQLQRKTSVCEELRESLTKERQLRLNNEAELMENKVKLGEISQLKQENDQLQQRNIYLCVTMYQLSCGRNEEVEKFKTQLTQTCEILQNTLTEERKLRLSYEAELDKNRAISSENCHLKNEIIDLKQRNSDLCLVIDQQNIQRAESDRKLAQELQSVEQQLQHKTSLCENLKDGFSNRLTLMHELYEKLESKTSLCDKLEKQFIAEQQRRLGLQSELNRVKDLITLENMEDTEPNEFLINCRSQGELPQSVSSKREKISKWRCFKKCITPTCLRKHKRTSDD